HVVKTDMAERRQLGGRPYGSGDKAWSAVDRKLLGDFPRQLRSRDIDLPGAVAEFKFVQNNARSAERIGLDHIAAYGKEVGMNLANDVRAAQDQHFGAILLAPIIIQSGIALLDVGTHRAVVNDDAFANGLEKIFHPVFGRWPLV